MRPPRLLPVLLASLLPACAPAPPTAPTSFHYTWQEPAMGTTFRIEVHTPELAPAVRAVEAAFARIHELDARLSDYQADSEVSRLADAARDADPGTWFPISAELAAVLTTGLSLAEATAGAFDPTLGRLTKLWRRSQRQQALPRPATLAEARAAAGYAYLDLDPARPAVRFLVPGIALDLGGIAKGYALDEAMRILREAGLQSALIDGGGDILVSGAPPERPAGWRIAIENGGVPGTQTLELQHTAVATSGDHYQSVSLDGRRYSHILDPETGLGLTRRRAATVTAPTAIEADALASAACVLGPDRVGLILARPGVTAFIHDAPEEQRPNILFILADDLGWADLGCQGSTSYRTPALDRLAGEGARFTQAYAAAANCAPTRATLMSGQSIPVHGVYTVGSGARGRKVDRSLIPPVNRTEIPTETVTLAEALQAAGYRTGHFGKWHLGAAGSPTGPRAQGFASNIGGDAVGHPPGYFWPYQRKNAAGAITRQLPGLEEGVAGEYLSDRLTDEAIRFLDADDGRPWFLYLPHYAVHTPIQAPAAAVAAIEERGLHGRQTNASYAAMVENLDRNCGRLLQWLEDHDQAARTLVIFTSDNGGYGGYLDAGVDQKDITHNHPLKGGKGMLSEGGLRVPLLLRWPGQVPAGLVSATPVHTLDFFPTLLQASGAAPPPQELEGLDLSPLWATRERDGQTTPSAFPERALYFHLPGYLEARAGTWRATPAGAIRRGRWKLIEPFDEKPVELYDLQADPGEQTNLARTHTETRDSLLKELRAWRTARAAPMPSPR